jgi:rhodanese-related sulfurtransferase
MLSKFAVVVAIGAPALSVLFFEVLLNATSMFNHTNMRIPTWIDRVLRWLVVTPDMHRVHHSILTRETNSNFGFNLPWWDRLFGTYKAQPAAGHEEMTIGVEQFRDPLELRLDRMLAQPFRGDPGPIARLRAPISWINAGDLKHRLDAGETLRIVDVRGPDEFVGPLGHIVEARNIPVAELSARLPELACLEPTLVVLVCLTDKRSSAAAETLSAAGFKHISVLRRGMKSWNESGFPVARNAA